MSANKLWGPLLVLSSAASSLVFACVTPFAAFAVITTMTMPLRQALGTVAAVWFANQAVGFGFLGYPIAADSIAWGLVMGVAVLAATLCSAAALTRLSSRYDGVTKYAAGFAAAFGTYQGGLILTAVATGDMAAFSAEIIGGIAVLNGVWTVALAGVHLLLTRMEVHFPQAARQRHMQAMRA